MIDLSVGQVSGLIAVGVFLLQTVLALALPMILVAFLTEENSLVTWSVLSRLLQSSHWPTILNTDTAASNGVRKSVITSSTVQMVILAVVSIASIVTPLGLYDAIAAEKTLTSESFTYLPDESSFGYGTPPRSTAPFTRTCGVEAACPGQTLNQTCNRARTNCTVSYDSLIPSSLRELYGNGSLEIGPSVSSLFDIQWRSYTNVTDPDSDIGWTLKPYFRELSNLILDEKIEPVEGLIVDMVAGGIGFRKHTAPRATLQYGATWSEDILFIEPETQCVDLNITLDYSITTILGAASGYESVVLTDHGGLSSLSHIQPEFPGQINGQGDLQLKQRAKAAAWLNNFMTLVYYNATGPDPKSIGQLNVTEGAKFPFPAPNCNSTDESQCTKGQFFKFEWNSIQSSQNYGGYLNLFNISEGFPAQLPNPHHLTSANLSTIGDLCAGTTVYSPPNINSSIVGCSLLYGVPQRTDGGSSLLAVPGSRWSTPIYSCATAVKASLRTVTFNYNGTSLNALRIASAIPKTYAHTSSLPLWGVETLPEDIPLSSAQPLWGLLGTANLSVASLTDPRVDNISTIAQPSLYLPGYMDSFSILQETLTTSISNSLQNLAGVDFYPKALQTALNIASNPSLQFSTFQGGADYSGYSSLALFTKWQTYNSAETVGSIINLIWTDEAANAVVGTRGWGLHTDAVGNGAARVETMFVSEATVPVTVYRRIVQYHIPFAIPAFIVLAGLIAVLIVLLVLLVRRKTGISRMREMLHATSVGRAVGAAAWPETTPTPRKTKQWIQTIGERQVIITKDKIIAEKAGFGDARIGEPEGSGDGEDDVACLKGQQGERVRLVSLGLSGRSLS